ncbi:hypothetical protein HMN09_00558500 [Mycena chlorophos]|uniref:Uncharacterized protein n=1 Tax=Mycena chlorophos TaxID=658473 RepID=A0A8H6T8C3_MYCCL|nr:hypothetical protein HMN09_00558500 [Mycena chlorophos]
MITHLPSSLSALSQHTSAPQNTPSCHHHLLYARTSQRRWRWSPREGTSTIVSGSQTVTAAVNHDCSSASVGTSPTVYALSSGSSGVSDASSSDEEDDTDDDNGEWEEVPVESNPAGLEATADATMSVGLRVYGNDGAWEITDDDLDFGVMLDSGAEVVGQSLSWDPADNIVEEVQGEDDDEEFARQLEADLSEENEENDLMNQSPPASHASSFGLRCCRDLMLARVSVLVDMDFQSHYLCSSAHLVPSPPTYVLLCVPVLFRPPHTPSAQ